MNRRLFLQSASIAAAWPVLCHAQKPDRIPVVGFLRAEAGLSESRPLTVQLEFYREALREIGYIDGKTIRFEQPVVAAGPDGFDVAAKQLVRSNVALIFAGGTPAALAACNACRTIPILVYVADPVGTGLVSLRRCAVYTDKIVRGAKPSELPVEQPTKFDLVVNLKTAIELGIKFPESIMLRATEVIR